MQNNSSHPINVLLAGILVSIACGIIGTFVVINRMVFISGGIAHAAYGGIGLGYFFGFNLEQAMQAEQQRMTRTRRLVLDWITAAEAPFSAEALVDDLTKHLVTQVTIDTVLLVVSAQAQPAVRAV
jgi:hypothetical protein